MADIPEEIIESSIVTDLRDLMYRLKDLTYDEIYAMSFRDHSQLLMLARDMQTVGRSLGTRVVDINADKAVALTSLVRTYQEQPDDES